MSTPSTSSPMAPEDSSEAELKYSPEVELLLCCRGANGKSRADRMRSLLEAGIDWPRLLRLASWHKMRPLLWVNLNQLDSPAVPSEMRDRMGLVSRMSAGRSLAMVGELLTILDLLEERGIEAIPYKGPALAERLYGNMALRESSDLDLMVARSSVAAVRELLLERGYVSFVSLQGANRKFLLESRYSERYDRFDGMVVELHWAFTNKDVAFPLTLEDLRPRLQEISLGRKTVNVFSSEDLFLILCVHGAKHLWNRLEWILGVAELAEEEIDWQLAWSRARETGSERMFLLGIALADELYRVPLPEEILHEARSIPAIGELVREVQQDLVAEEMIYERDETNNVKYDLFHYQLGDNFRNRVRYLFYRVTTPSHPQHWTSISIGERRLALHAFVRPFRLVSKFATVLRLKAMNALRGRAHTKS